MQILVGKMSAVRSFVIIAV